MTRAFPSICIRAPNLAVALLLTVVFAAASLALVRDVAHAAPAPKITSVSPAGGPVAGGTSVTITGSKFTSGTTVNAVSFGGTAAASFTVDSNSQITATTAARAAGVVDVVVTKPGDESGTKSSAFTYAEAPTTTAVSPVSGASAGGTSVTITGTNFLGVSAVTFDGNAATGVTTNSATQLTVTTPAGTRGKAVDVVVTAFGGAVTSTGAYTYLDKPTITSVSPNGGRTAGGTTVTIKAPTSSRRRRSPSAASPPPA